MNSSENKNLVLAMVLMLAVWLGFSFFFPPATKEQSQPIATQQEQTPLVVEVEEQVVPVSAIEVKGMSVAPANAPATTTSAPAREIVVETDKGKKSYKIIN